MGGDEPQKVSHILRNFVKKVVNSALERQVGEAVRMQLRHNVPNSVGTIRCKLNRLIIDSDWDAKVWKENWPKNRQKELQ